MRASSVKEEMYYHPERFPSTWWHAHPIWTQLIKERGFIWTDETWANTADLVLREQVR